ncbi:hypothetical protein ACU8OG_26585 (plasmid) [Rhizobium leguminosarum]
METSRYAVLKSIISDYVGDRGANPDGTRIAMALGAETLLRQTPLQERSELPKGVGGSGSGGHVPYVAETIAVAHEEFGIENVPAVPASARRQFPSQLWL